MDPRISVGCSLNIRTDFRQIPMGEIDLQHEIQFDDDSGIVYRRRGQRCARRMYSARIDGCKTAMTVTLYQGPNAEQAWQKDISMHSWLRHPNFVQLYGVASTGPMYAAVFHDDLIPLEQFRDIHYLVPLFPGLLGTHIFPPVIVDTEVS
ncbi:hypothetical protein B0H16DRAFT_134256 [Mycena metata]|uniref:Protein kinase domain-containing protein n=1 Tax=Mycena metata TaxID=1033252 RepID=A0AAD7I568_9AGAR|nr:hypothetical protein B0H16DRAFT_134256 [Mycena metata]